MVASQNELMVKIKDKRALGGEQFERAQQMVLADELDERLPRLLSNRELTLRVTEPVKEKGDIESSQLLLELRNPPIAGASAKNKRWFTRCFSHLYTPLIRTVKQQKEPFSALRRFHGFIYDRVHVGQRMIQRGKLTPDELSGVIGGLYKRLADNPDVLRDVFAIDAGDQRSFNNLMRTHLFPKKKA